MILIVTLLILAVHSTSGSHFRGGSMSWRPIGNNQIEVLYRVGFKYNHEEFGFDPCTAEARRDQTVLDTSGVMQCSSCSSVQRERQLQWICDDYDVDQDYALGHKTLIYDIPATTPVFVISYEHCCWVDLESPVDRSGGAKGWKMMTTVNLIARKDGNINSSPQPGLIPLEKFYKGCQYQLRIAVTDPDNDVIRCRYADMRKDECPAQGNKKACGPETDGLTIQKKDCTLYYDTDNVAEGYHAVNVIIEDFARPYNRKSKALSKVSLLFLLLVEEQTAVCQKPNIVDPPACKAARPGEPFQMVVRAEAGDPAKPISRIKTQRPHDMQSSATINDPENPLRKMVTLSWTPTIDHIGKHPVCFSALDSDSFTSGMSCTIIHVDDNPLQLIPDASHPPPNGAIDTGEGFVIRFNNQIAKPRKAAYVKLVDPDTDEVAVEMSTNGRSVIFGDGTSFVFIPPRDELFSGAPTGQTKQFVLRIDSGVALTPGSECGTEATEWRVDITDVIPPTEAPICNQGPLEIFVANEHLKDSEECSLMLPDDTVQVTGDLETIPYKVCCPSTCTPA